VWACQLARFGRRLRAVQDRRLQTGSLAFRTRRGATAAFIAGLALFLGTGVVHAAEPWALEAELPPGCGSAAEFQREVDRRVRQGVKVPATVLRIAPGLAGYRLEMRVGGEHRQLEDRDCAALFRAAVVVTVAITLSENAERTPREAVRPEPQPAPEPPPAPPTSRPSGSGPELALGLGAGIEFGLEPQAAPAIDVLGKARWRRFGVALGARYLAARETQDESGRGVRIQALALRASALYRPARALELGLGLGASDLFGAGIGPGRRDDSAWAYGPFAWVGVLPLETRWFWLELSGELHWNMQRPKFEILQYGEIFSSSPLSGGIFLHGGARFP
jgi:hypothetical protein